MGCCKRKPVLVRQPLMVAFMFSDFVSIRTGYFTHPSAGMIDPSDSMSCLIFAATLPRLLLVFMGEG